MEVAIRKMGNSQGVLIPKPILAQVGLQGTADLQVRDGVNLTPSLFISGREGIDDLHPGDERAVLHVFGEQHRAAAGDGGLEDQGVVERRPP